MHRSQTWIFNNPGSKPMVIVATADLAPFHASIGVLVEVPNMLGLPCLDAAALIETRGLIPARAGKGMPGYTRKLY
jgi:hypothetical protein